MSGNGNWKKHESAALIVTAATATLFAYWWFLGKRHSDQREDLMQQLNLAKENVRELEDKLTSLEESREIVNTMNRPRSRGNSVDTSSDRQIRIWMDGAFDMFHYGHMNAFRQGKSCGTYLIVGVNSDESITRCKGAPVMNDDERLAAVSGCRFVDEVVKDVPYIMNEEYINHIIEKYKIDFVVHGDDPCIVDGKDVYETAKRLGKYKTIPRTEGISTTDIVGRMLLMTKSHHQPATEDETNSGGSAAVVATTPVRSSKDSERSFSTPGMKNSQLILSKAVGTSTSNKMVCKQSNFLTTSRVMRLFSASVKAPERGDRVVYIAGSWDMFHAGHIAMLQKAKEFGDYVLVGIYNDVTVNRMCRERDEVEDCNLPIMNLHERVLSVLGCKHVDDVLIDAPYVVTRDMINSLNISAVVVNHKGRGGIPLGTVAHGHSGHGNGNSDDDTVMVSPNREMDSAAASSAASPGTVMSATTLPTDPYAEARAMGILRSIDFIEHGSLSVVDIISRIQAQHERFRKKHRAKKAAEDSFYGTKYSAGPALAATGGTAASAPKK